MYNNLPTVPSYPGSNAQAVVATRAPATSDNQYQIGQQWINTSANAVYFLTSLLSGSANWEVSGSPSAIVSTLTATSGGAISPVSSNINIVGGANITTSGAGSTITAALNSSVATATLATNTAATNMSLNAATISMAGSSNTDVGLTVTPKGAGALTVTTGDVVASAGNLQLSAAGSMIKMHGSAGSTDFCGQNALAGAPRVITIAGLLSTDLAFISRAGKAGASLGLLSGVCTANTLTVSSFNPSDGSANTDDSSTFNYFIVRPL